MAIFVLKDSDAVQPNPEKDRRGSYKRGDIIAVHEDSAHDGDLVANPIAAPFYLVKVTGVTKAQAERFLAPRFETVTCWRCGGSGVMMMDTNESRFCIVCDSAGFVSRPHTCREWSIPIAALPVNVRNALTQRRYYETTLVAVRTFIRNKRTGETA